MCPGVVPEGWLRCFAHPLAGVVCSRYAQYPAFAPGCSKVTVGSHKDSEAKNIQINFHCKVKELLQWRITGLNVNIMT